MIVVVPLILCLSLTSGLAQTRPDCSGKWTKIPPAAGESAETLAITQTPDTVTVHDATGQWVHKLDGPEGPSLLRVAMSLLGKTFVVRATSTSQATNVVFREQTKRYSRQLPAPGVVAVGAFSNIRYTEEHAYGQAVQLWRQGDRLLGLFMYTDGLQADFHTGLLEHVMFNPGTGQLSFDAYASQFHFKGRLEKMALTGLLKRTHPVDGRQVAADQVTLKRSAELTGEMRTYESEEEWNQYAAEVLKRLGPRGKS